MAPDADLVIVGCGPVGVMAALLARQHGLSAIALACDKVIAKASAIGFLF